MPLTAILLAILAAPHPAARQRCDHFVYLEDGAFKLQGKPWPLKSVNFRVEVVGRENAGPPAPGTLRVTVEGKSLDLFLAACGSYSPDNNSWCRDPPEWNPQMKCCADAAACALGLNVDVDQLRALGVNSVRLLMDTWKIRNGVPTFGIGRMPWVWRDFFLDLRDPAHRAAALKLQKRAVQALGSRGIRSLMLLNGAAYFRDKPEWNKHYLDSLSALAAAMRDEPWLVGLDFYNEPSWAPGAPQGTHFEIDKGGARDLVKTWVAAVRQQNPHALLTIGNAFALASLDTWDPAFLPVDFNSYHIYPPNPIAWPAARAFVERETFYSSLGACGVPCPSAARFDGAHCLVREGPVGTEGHADDDGSFTFKGGTCPPANRRPHGRCWVGSYERGRDEPFVLHQPHYYVKKASASCPAGTSFDGANCLAGAAPPGAKPFLHGSGFYYQYLFRTYGGNERCRAPARDDGANCIVAPVPAGHVPFILQRPMFYVKATHCTGGRKPILVGEFGAAVHDYDPKTGAILKPSHGDAASQAAYLRAVGERAHACGYQGVQWWQHGDVHWGDPATDHYGLWADFRQVHPGQPVPAPDAMVMRPAGMALRALDLHGPRHECPRPADWMHALFGPGISGSKFRYVGKVFDQNARGVPFAMLKARLSGSGDVFFTAHADHKGNYDFKTPRLVEKIRATHFGHHTTRWHIPVPLVPTLIKLKRAGAAELPAYAPPSRDAQACRAVE